MWIKICGNTNLDDCLLASSLGADAVGFVFAPGKRTVSAAHVAQITPSLPASLERIGVFTTTSVAEVLETVESCGLTGAQLHGPLDLSSLRRVHSGMAALRPSQARLIQVLPWWTDRTGSEQAASFRAQAEEVIESDCANAILIDSRTASEIGGTGRSFDWAAAQAAMPAGRSVRWIVAGGLHAENVAVAVTAMRPWGIDVVSGVEAAPGRKDRAKLQRFMETARAVNVQT